jgi:membrane fusion protein, multidrug efflux system
MRARSAIVFVMAILALAAAFAVGLWAGRERSTATPAASPKANAAEEPFGTVTLTKEAQSQGGIETASVAPRVLYPRSDAYATVLDAQPLIALAKQRATAEAAVRAADAVAAASKAEYERTRTLYADDRNMSRKALQSAEAAWSSDEAKAQGAAASLREVESSAEQQFGQMLASWASAPSSPQMLRLAPRKEVLVRVALPATVSGAAPSVVSLSAPGYARSDAHLVSASAQSDPEAPGRTFLYRASAPYPGGLRLMAEVPLASKGIEGFVVPESAVVWYGNAAWVFVKTAEERFVRRALRDPQSRRGEIFTTTPFDDDDRIVVTGAQLLQSELLRAKTLSTSGCTDPGCDD